MKNLSKLLFTTICLGVILLTSCNIGLGAAVDTQPPEISISHPTADAQTRSTIILDGTWSDDLSVAFVTTVLREVETKKEYEFTGVKAGTSETEGTWTCTIDPLDSKNPVPDGTYVATVTAEDTYGHKGNASVTFSIDNTVPLIVLSSPSTTEIGNPTAFGQVFTVEGKAADDSDIDSVDVIIYDTNNVEVGRKTISNVSTQIDVNVAEWGDDVYKAVYGEDKEAGTKGYYIGIVAYDGARQVPAVEGDRGNCATYFYMNNDFAALNGFKTSTAYKLLNGSRTANDYSDWISLLDSKKIEKATISLNPVNNPYFEVQNFEPITVGKENELEDPSGKYKYINKSAGSINLFVGRDKKSIKVDTIGIYLRECDVTGKLVKDGKVVTVLQPYTDKDGNVYKDANGKELITKAAHDAVIQTVGSTSYKTSFTLNVDEMQNLSIGTYYIWDVVAFDYNNIGIRNDSIYAIKMASSSAAPSVTITNPTGISKTIASSESFPIEGKITTELKDVAVRVYISDSEKPYSDGDKPYASSVQEDNTSVKITKTQTSEPNATTRSWDFALTIPEKAKEKDTFTVTLIVSDPSEPGTFTRKDIEVSNDMVGPTFGTCSISPEVEVEEAGKKVQKVNGIVQIKQAVDDNNIVQETYYSKDDGATWISCGKTTMMNFEIDTTEFTTTTATKKIWLKAIDNAGNETLIDDNSTSVIVLDIDQSTDAPVISLSNVTVDQISQDDIVKAESSEKNILGRKQNNLLLGTVTDDDGIKNVTFKWTKDNPESPTATWNSNTIQVGKTTYSIALDLSAKKNGGVDYIYDEGLYYFKIVVEDTAKKTTYATTTTRTQSDIKAGKKDYFAIAIDEGAPNFVVTTTNGALQAAEQDLPVTGNWSEGTNIITVVRYQDENGTTAEADSSKDGSSIKVNDDGTWSDTIPADIVGTKGGARYYVATDPYGQKTNATFSFKVDSSAPVFTITDVNGIKESGNLITLNKDSNSYSAFAKTSGIFTVKGTIAEPDPTPTEIDDLNNGAGLEDFIYYYVTSKASDVSEDNGSYEIDGNNKQWTKVGITKEARDKDYSEKGSWTANIDLSSGYVEGTSYTLYIAAKDKARNITKVNDNPSALVIIKPDSNGPEFTEQLKVNTTSVTSTTTGDIVFTVKVTDNTSGVEKVCLYLNDADTNISPTNSGNTYTFKIPSTVGETGSIIKTGVNTFKVRAYDKVENYSDSDAVTVSVDKTAPTASISGISPVYTQSTEGGKTTYVVSDKVTAKVIVTDETKLKEIRWFFGTVPVNYAAVNKQSGSLEGTYKEYEFEIDTSKVTFTSGKTELSVVAVDYSDNISTVASCILGQDTEKPVLGTPAVTSKKNSLKVDYYNLEQNLTVSVTVNEGGSDVSLQSGIASVEYGFAKGHNKETADVTSWESATEKSPSNWTAKIDNNQITAEGEYTVFIKATDKAENVAYTAPINIVADEKAPVIDISKVETYYTGKVEITGTVTETYLREFKVTEAKEKTFTSDKEPAVPGKQTAPQDWKITIPATDGEYNFTITAKDEFNTTQAKDIKFNIDTKAPTFTITKVQDFTTDLPTSSVAKEYYGNTTNYFTIKGEVKDEPKVTGGYASGTSSSMYYIVKKRDEPLSGTEFYTIDNSWSSAPIKTDGTWEAPISLSSFAEGDTLDVYFATKDNAGNTSLIKDNPAKKITIKIDGTAPDVKAPVITIGETETTVKVAAKDAVSGLDNDVIKLDGNEYKKSTQSTAAGTGDDAGYTIYTYTITNSDAGLNVGANSFTVTFTDKAGNSRTSTASVINNNAPSFSDVILPETLTSKNGEYTWAKASFDMTGKVSVKATDKNKFGKLTWKDTYEVNGVLTDLESGNATVGADNSFKVTVDPSDTTYSSYENKKVTRTFTATNVYGQSTTAELKFVTDITNPVIQLSDVESDSGTGAKIGGELTKNLTDKWFNSKALSISGSYLDNGSGVEKVTYTLNSTDTGDIYTSKATISGKTYYKFSGTKDGFAEGSLNTVKLEAVDKAGNVADTKNYSVKVDTTAPKVQGDLNYYVGNETTPNVYTNAILTNKGKSIKVTGSFSDENSTLGTGKEADVSGIKSITAEIDGAKVDAKVTGTTSGTWELLIDFNSTELKSKMKTDSTYTVAVVLTDNAGNIDNSTTFALKVDSSKPTTTIDSPSTTKVLNGLNTFNGSVKDNNNPKSIELRYVFSADKKSDLTTIAKWPETSLIGKKTVGDKDVDIGTVSSWKFEDINVNNYLGTNTSGYLYILPIAYDEAGNCNIDETQIKTTDYFEYSVDLDSDRPTIQFSNLPKHSGAGTQFLTHTTKLTGSVTDDDGVAELKIVNSTEAPADWSTVAAQEDPTTISFDLGADGEKTIWFYIKDGAGTEFITGKDWTAANKKTIYLPKLIYSSKTAGVADTGDNTGKIEFTTDSNAPTVGVPSYGWAETGDDATTAAKTADSTAGNYAVITTGDLAGGKLRKNIVFALEATDAGSQIKSTKVTSGTDVDESFTKGTGDIWYTAPIDVSTLSSGTRTFTFTVTDNAGLVQTATAQLVIDNTPPVATLISPVDEVTGDVTLTGTTVDENSSVISTKYLVINNDNKDKTDAEKIAAAAGTIKEGKNASGWSFELNGKGTTPNAKLPANKTDLLVYSEITHDENDVYTLPIALVTEDILGNVGITETTITYNPYGDRPKTEITYPNGYWGSATNTKVSAETGAASYQNVNGSIRITGAATDNNSLSDATKVKVYFQLDLNNDGEFDDDDNALVTSDYTVVDSTAFPTGADASAIEDDGTFWGIAATGTNSWNFTLNSSGELQTDDTKFEDGKYKVGIRALTIDEHGVVGKWSVPAYFMIDMNAPQIGSASLVESATATVARSYQEDMFLKGTQYLKVPITDKTGIKKITYSYAKDLAALQASPAGSVSIELAGQTSGYEAPDGTIVEWTGTSYTAFIPVSTLPSKIAAANKSIALKVTAYKDSESESTDYQRYSMSFDNTAPDVSYIRFNADEGDEEEGSMKNRIVNNNGTFFTLAGKVHDDDSGFDKIAFYYYRDKQDNEGQKRRVYDPMMASTTTGSTTTYASTVQVTKDSSTDLYSGISKVDIKKNPADTDSVPLYGYTKSVTVGENGNTITLGTALTDSDHIRAGGLVQINSIWHVISQIDTTKKVLTLSTATTATGTSNAFFPIAQVIDNTGSEKTQTNGELLDADSGDDGDGMPESIIKAGTYWTYDASIHSNYIPDGPGTLVTILWDKAGNVEFKTYTASVQNNAPRLTKLWLGTSLSSSMTESNFTEFDVLAKAGEQRSYEMLTANYNNKKRFRVKGDLAVVTEFVGGNNATNKTDGSRIKMVYNNDSTSDKGYVTADATKSNVYTRDDTLSAKSWFTHSTGYEDGELENFAFKIPAAELGDDSTYTTDYSAREMSFTFWDITDETTQCKNSCYCYLNIKDFIVMVQDNFAPTAAIDPFFWKSGDDNSLYQNSYKNGHIDLPTATGATLDTKTGLFKNDDGLIAGTATNKPQVSGIVSVRGSVLDEHALDSIWVTFTSNAATPESVFTPATSAYYDDEGVYYQVAKSTTTGWETKAGTFATETQTWTDAATPVNASGAVWKFTILSDVSSQEGQKVEWQLDIDTSAMEDGMGTNKVFRVMAKDKADDPHSSTETISGSIGTDGKYDLLTEGVNHPTYTVDVVPYVSSVSSVSGTDPNYVYTDAPRSKLGRYSVQAGQKIALKGFNFGSSTSTVSATKTIGDGKTTSTESWTTDATRVDANTVIVTAPNYSGFINLTVGGIAVPNNTNSNTTYNIQEGYLASEADTYGAVAANKNGTNFWTDDVYVSVWNNKNLTGSVNPWDGTVRKIKSSDLKSNEFYVNASGNSVDRQNNSLDTWFGAYSSPNMMIYDEMGNGAMTYHRTLYNNSQAAFVSPVETMDMTIIGGIPWYVFNDNYVGGNSANSWGAGLIVAREGYSFPKSAFNGTNSPTEMENQNIIERQGSGQSSDSRDPSSGYDSVLNQFKNPRITGWYDPTSVTMNNGNGSQTYPGTNYVYVSYYDSFAHCLKYAAFSEAWDNAGRGEKWGNVNGSKNFTSITRAADNMKKPSTVVAGVDRLYTAYDFSTANGEDCGEWSDIMIDPSDHRPVIIYYNKTKGTLEVAHGKSTTPSTANYKTKEGAFTDTTEGTNGWTKTKGITPASGSDFGRYVSAEIDANGNIHATAQNFTTGDLYYVFLEKQTNNSYKPTYQIVDATGSTAILTDIQLANNVNSNTSWEQYQPVISYVNQSKKQPKAAFVEKKTIGTKDYYFFEAVSDANNYEAKEMKTSVMTDVYETTNSGVKSKVGIGFNSDVLAVDFLRDEK